MVWVFVKHFKCFSTPLVVLMSMSGINSGAENAENNLGAA
jgi:hypothetical protein